VPTASSSCQAAPTLRLDGLKRDHLERADAGDIVAVAGVEDIQIGDTIADRERPRRAPASRIDERRSP
jgi:GTP-binding protein